MKFIRSSSTPQCCFRRYRSTKSLTVVALGIVALLLMEFHVHRRFILDISSSSKSPTTEVIQKLAPPRQLSKHFKPPSSNFSIFYNAYINPDNVTLGVRIIEQQIRQFYLTKYHIDTPLYYNLIGYNYTKRFCPHHVHCQQLHYYPQGGEEKTLQDLYEYCRQHPADQVIYLHNKGSFSPHTQNEIKRKRVTHALSRSRTLHDKKCNVLTHTWEPLPHFHAQSNMWHAKCSYVVKLIPPIEYEQRRVDMFRELLSPPALPSERRNRKNRRHDKHDKYKCLATLFNRSRPEIYLQSEGLIRAVGMGRYIHEFWVYSHPDLEPCNHDFSLGNPLLERPDALLMRFRYAWFRQPGRLWEYQYLYHKLPTNTSFFWNFFANATGVKRPRQCRNDPLILGMNKTRSGSYIVPAGTSSYGDA